MADLHLERRLRALAWGDKQVLVGFLRHLAEFDFRKLYAARGFSSLFRYCTEALRFSEDEAYLRIQAARLSRGFPEVLQMLARGETHLSCLARLAPVLTTRNSSLLLAEARGKSKRDVERIAARYASGPRPLRDAIRFLPAGSGPPPRAFSTLSGIGAPEGDRTVLGGAMASPNGAPTAPDCREGELLSWIGGTGVLAAGAAAQAPGRPAGVLAAGAGAQAPGRPAGEGESMPAGGSSWAAADSTESRDPRACARNEGAREPLVRIAFTASHALLRKIEKSRALLRHKHPSGRLELLVDEAFEALLARRDPGRWLSLPSPRPGGEGRNSASGGTPPESSSEEGVASARSRRIPRRVRKDVWSRDGGRCAFVSADGRRCDAREWLEYDHILPFALGGSSTDPANIRLACRTHNQFLAERVFGVARSGSDGAQSPRVTRSGPSSTSPAPGS